MKQRSIQLISIIDDVITLVVVDDAHDNVNLEYVVKLDLEATNVEDDEDENISNDSYKQCYFYLNVLNIVCS